MVVLSVILGVLMVCCGFACMFSPLITFMQAGYFIVILVAVYGVIGIVRSIAEKHFGVGFVFSIISAIFAIVVLFFPKLMMLTDGVMIYLTAAWFVLQGIVAIFTAIEAKRATGSKLWIPHLILGIIAVLLGCYSFFHPALVVVTIAFLIGFYFIEIGFTLLFFPAGKRND